MLQQSFPFLVIMIILKFNINHKIMLFEVGTQSQRNKIKFSLYVNVICSNSTEILPTRQFDTVDSEVVDLHKNTG